MDLQAAVEDIELSVDENKVVVQAVKTAVDNVKLAVDAVPTSNVAGRSKKILIYGTADISTSTTTTLIDISLEGGSNIHLHRIFIMQDNSSASGNSSIVLKGGVSTLMTLVAGSSADPKDMNERMVFERDLPLVLGTDLDFVVTTVIGSGGGNFKLFYMYETV